MGRSISYFAVIVLAGLAALGGNFGCGGGGDSIRPTVVSTIPADGATAVEVSDPDPGDILREDGPFDHHQCALRHGIRIRNRFDERLL
jgi:hypothetical protein